MTFALTDQGVTVDTIDDIATRLATNARAPGGIDPNLDTSELSPFGRLFGMIAIELSGYQKVARDIWAAATVTATGQALKNNALLTGTKPQDPTKSTVSASATLTAGTTVVKGSRANVAGDTTALFESTADVTNSSGITATIAMPMQAVTAGAVRAPAALLTVINTPVAGWLSVTNAFDATIGKPAESDPDLRLRRQAELAVSGSTTVLAIEADVLNVTGILDTVSAENLTDLTDVNGLPPHSFEIVVWDGAGLAASDNAIAQVILDGKASGIASVHGSGGTSASGSAVDVEGNTHSVAFTRASALNAYIGVAVTVNASKFPVDGVAQIQAALAAAFNADQRIGVEAIITKYFADVYAIAGVIEATMALGSAPSPSDVRLAVTRAQIALADTSRIAVVVT